MVNDHILYEKIKENYRKSIRGLWEGRRTAGGSTEYHRWEFKEDGTFKNRKTAAEQCLLRFFLCAVTLMVQCR